MGEYCLRLWISTLASRGFVIPSVTSASFKVRLVVYSECRLGFDDRCCRGALKGVESRAGAHPSFVQIDLLQQVFRLRVLLAKLLLELFVIHSGNAKVLH